MKPIRAVIFGSNGQDGYYLRRLLERERIECICISRTGEEVHGDVGDYRFVEKQIKEYRPEHIFHFAANSSTQHSTLFENHQAISTGTMNILEAVKLYCSNARVFLSGSAVQFKNNGSPIDEKTPFEGSSPYAVARIHSVYLARYYRGNGLKVYVGYFFHHDSPLRTERHVNQKIVQAVKRIQAGSAEKLELGNIDVRKEFNFAGDIVEAIWTLVNQDDVFETVIGNGEVHSIREWVEYCFAKKDKDWKKFVILKKNFTPEFDILVSNPKLIKSLGWEPKVDFRQLADMMLDTPMI